MAIQIKEIQYGEYGRCVQISNGLIEAVVTVDIGPRIIRFGFTGRENMLCEAPDQKSENGWRILGGHRLWHSPENMPRTYELENAPVKWEKIEGGIRVTQNPEPFAQTVKEMDIMLDDESSEASIVHRMRNVGAWPVELALWSITVMAPGGKEVIPMVQEGDNLALNRTMSLWPYTNMGDHRVWWGDRYIVLKQDPDCQPPFKVGLNNEYGWGAYFNHNQAFIKQFVYEEGETYPDNGCSYETYTTNFMLEMETLSPVVKLEPGEEADHMEVWYLVDDVAAPENNDEAIDEVMDDLLGDCCDCDECGDECGCGCGCEDCEDDECECEEEEDK